LIGFFQTKTLPTITVALLTDLPTQLLVPRFTPAKLNSIISRLIQT